MVRAMSSQSNSAPAPDLDLTDARPWPRQPLAHLDALWIQVAGTLCNLACTHCFVPSGPGVDRHRRMSRAEVAARVREGLDLGVREIYFTGGEPFVHPEMLEILTDTLELAPCTVLTNGTLLTHGRIAALARLDERSRYSLEVRVSLDGLDAEDHDPVRGPGTFARTLEALGALERAGLLPIVTFTQHRDEDPLEFGERCLGRLRRAGLRRPRLKVIPLFRLGRETTRSRPYSALESLADLPPTSFDPHRLQCSSCRAVTSRGVFVCPLLVDEPRARLGERLAEALEPFPLAHGACFTCWATGMTCGNG